MNQIMWEPKEKQTQTSQMITFMNIINKRFQDFSGLQRKSSLYTNY